VVWIIRAYKQSPPSHVSLAQPARVKEGFSLAGGLASNGYDNLSPGKYALYSCFVAEVVLTVMFLMVILGVTDSRAPAGFVPLAIGLGLTLIHLISIPVTNTSVNPARSTGPALFAGGNYSWQLWLFWVAPILGESLPGSSIPPWQAHLVRVPRGCPEQPERRRR
jgi:aquaporin Z